MAMQSMVQWALVLQDAIEDTLVVVILPRSPGINTLADQVQDKLKALHHIATRTSDQTGEAASQVLAWLQQQEMWTAFQNKCAQLDSCFALQSSHEQGL